MHTRLVPILALLGAVSIFPMAAWASCSAADPTGYYRGTAQSKEAGTLAIAVNLRCTNGKYAGEVITPAGTFTITGGDFNNGSLHLTFGGGSIGDAGTIDASFQGTTGLGTFRLAADSGSFSISRVEDAHAPISNEPLLTLPASKWIYDLQFEVMTLETRHPNAFKFTPRSTFEPAVAELERRMPILDGDTIYMGLDHIANMVGDAHTYVEFPPDSASMPLVIERFGKSYRIVEAADGYETLLGKRVIAIGDESVGSIHDRFVEQVTPVAETSLLRDARATNFLSIGMALHGIGVTANRQVALYTVMDGNVERRIEVRALAASQASATHWTWVAPRPLYRQRPDNDFWFVYLPNERAVYCSFRAYENLQTRAADLLAFVRAKRPDKLVIDLRLNGGGDFKEGFQYLIDPIRSMSQINRKGHLFILVGVSTFSAAMSNAAQFRTATQAILVGQTIGERPNSYQEPNEERLPNSNLLLRYSTKYYAFAPEGINELVPDKQIVPTWNEVASGRDPVLEWVLSPHERRAPFSARPQQVRAPNRLRRTE